MKEMAASYGVDISKPAKNAKEAVQAVYMGYLAGTKENNGAATSLGRTSTFLDIYIERDLKKWSDHRNRSSGIDRSIYHQTSSDKTFKNS